MKRAGDALRQAFMSRDDYEALREEDKVLDGMAKPTLAVGSLLLGGSVLVAGTVMTDILFEITGKEWPSCQKKRMTPLEVNIKDRPNASYMLTEEEAARYFLVVIFLPTLLVFFLSVVYLIAGIVVAYSAPKRNLCLKVVENNCCAAKRGGVRCLATLNIAFLVAFALMALFLGSSILTLQTDCSLTLFWCYEIVCWGLVFLFGGAAFFLNRKSAQVMDEGEHYGHHAVGVEMLETSIEPTPEVQRRIVTGFRSWMGPSIVSSDDEGGDLDEFWDDEVQGPYGMLDSTRVGHE